jgi:hypothetical protein
MDCLYHCLEEYFQGICFLSFFITIEQYTYPMNLFLFNLYYLIDNLCFIKHFYLLNINQYLLLIDFLNSHHILFTLFLILIHYFLI